MQKSNIIKAIFFDLGETLVNLSSISTSMSKSLKNHLPQVTKDVNKLASKWGYGTQELFMILRKKKFITAKEIHLLYLKKMLKMNNIQISERVAYTLVEDVWNDYVDNNKIYPDTIPVLKQLKQYGYTLGIITDCDFDVAEGILKKHQLTDFFDIKIISSLIKSYKPDPLLFNKAIELAKCAPQEGVYVGDSEIDIKGAKETGLITGIVDRGEIQNKTFGIKSDFRINNLVDLPKIISKLKRPIG